MCIGRDAPFVRSTRSHKIQTGTGQESTPFVRRIGPDKTPRCPGIPALRPDKNSWTLADISVLIRCRERIGDFAPIHRGSFLKRLYQEVACWYYLVACQ